MNIRTMTLADIPFAMRLKAQNNWNQVEADWERQLALEPSGSFVAEVEGTPIGTACACVFGDVAWVNYVLVDKERRGQGTGAALMRHVLAWLDALGVPTIRLDATALGQPVYAKLGFVGDFMLARYEGILPSSQELWDRIPILSVERQDRNPVPQLNLSAIFALDESITKTRRDKLLRHLHEANPTTAFRHHEGYVLCRPGSNAWQFGPLQGSADAAAALLATVCDRLAGQRVYIDVPLDNAAACAMMQTLGLTTQRTFLRMTRGRRIEEDLQRFWAGSGPEKG